MVYKMTLCKDVLTGICKLGKHCQDAHNKDLQRNKNESLRAYLKRIDRNIDDYNIKDIEMELVDKSLAEFKNSK